jgi:ribosomal protein L11 methyltransferase
MDNYHPIAFGQRLWIVPSWRQAPDPTAINIKLDPGLAFGTGTHATTALCLEWLDQHLQGAPRVIDFGCGSGILAIAAAKLGSAEVYAVDNDPQALIATRANAEKNGLVDNIRVSTPDAVPQQTVNILLANILAQPLIDLAPKLSGLVKAQGDIVLSGILEDQAQDVINAYTPFFIMDPMVKKDDWVRLHGIRRETS